MVRCVYCVCGSDIEEICVKEKKMNTRNFNLKKGLFVASVPKGNLIITGTGLDGHGEF